LSPISAALLAHGFIIADTPRGMGFRMTTLSAEMANKAARIDRAQKTSGENAVQNSTLDSCYRQIGISAVAAAARYQGVAKNPVYAPAPMTADWQDYTGDTAA
jgi:hypothetical protein